MDGQTTREKYISPFSTRYASEEMQYLFSDTHKFRTWRRLWIALARAEKELGLPITDAQIAELDDELAKLRICAAARLTVEQVTALRAKCRAAGVDYCVLKNTLVRRAMANKGIEIDEKLLEGPNAFIFSNNDPVSAPKLVKEFIAACEKDKKTSPLTIKAGVMDGAVQSVEEVKALADRICLSCEEDGVARQLEELELI